MAMFDKSQKISSAKTTKKVTKQEIGIDGLKTYAAIDSIEKALKSLKSVYRDPVEESMIKHFIDVAVDTKSRPENFVGKDKNAKASCELRQRSSASALSEQEQEILAKHGIKTKVVEDKAETYVINPAYLNDSKLLEKISKILSKDKSIPEDLIKFQESNKKTVIDEEGFAAAFKMPREALKEILPVIGTLAIKPSLDGIDAVREAFDIVKELVDDEAE